MGQRAQRVRVAQPLQAPPPKLLDCVRSAIRTRHYSIRTEEAYVIWIRRSILFHNKRHPAEMGESEISQFLTHLGTHSKCPFSGSYWRHSSSSHQRWVVGQFLRIAEKGKCQVHRQGLLRCHTRRLCVWSSSVSRGGRWNGPPAFNTGWNRSDRNRVGNRRVFRTTVVGSPTNVDHAGCGSARS